MSPTFSDEATLEQASPFFEWVHKFADHYRFNDLLHTVHYRNQSLMSGVWTLIILLVFKDWDKPAPFEFINRFNAVDLVLAYHCKVLSVRLKLLLDQLLADVVHSWWAFVFNFRKCAYNILLVDGDVLCGINLYVKVYTVDMTEFWGECGYLFLLIHISKFFNPIVHLLTAVLKKIVIFLPAFQYGFVTVHLTKKTEMFLITNGLSNVATPVLFPAPVLLIVEMFD